MPASETVESSGRRCRSRSQAHPQVETSRDEEGVRTAPAGLTFPRFFTEAGVDPFDEVEWELRSAVIGNERGEVVFEQRDVEIPEVLVAAGDQHRRLQVFPRADRHAGARAQRQAAHRPRGRHDHRVGARAEVFRERRGPAGVQRRSEAHPRVSEGGVQQPGLVQLRVREGAAVLGLLHQLGPGHDGLDPDAGADRGDAVQVRIGHRHQPVADPLVEESCWPAAAPRRVRSRS